MENSKKKIWNKYKKIHLNFAIAISQLRMITIASTEALDDFPNNLPNNIQQPFKENMIKTLTNIRDQLKKGGTPKFRLQYRMVQFSVSEEKRNYQNMI